MIRDLENLASQSGTTADGAIQAVTDKEYRSAVGQFNTSQAAGTYDLLTANGDVLVDLQLVYVKTAPTGLTSVSMATNHATPKSVVASTALASLGVETQPSIVTSRFVLPSGKKIQGTIVGTGTAGLILVIANYIPLTVGATLS